MKRSRPRRPLKARTPVRAALRGESPLQAHVQDGLGAVSKAHTALLDDSVKHDLVDSLDLDAALASAHPEERRWDYLLGHKPTSSVIALESHTATDKEVKVLIEKREAALLQLREHLREGVRPSVWIWVTEGKVGFAQTEKCARRLDQVGITFANRRVLAKHLPSR